MKIKAITVLWNVVIRSIKISNALLSAVMEDTMTLSEQDSNADRIVLLVVLIAHILLMHIVWFNVLS